MQQRTHSRFMMSCWIVQENQNDCCQTGGGWSRSFCIVRIGPKPEKKFRGNKPLNDIQIFKNEEFSSVRTVTMDGEPWFVGKDVARCIGYKDAKAAVRDHVDDFDKGVCEIPTPGGKQNITVINESGLYNLILSSKLPTAKKFKRWVTSEVLPSIRKHGNTAITD